MILNWKKFNEDKNKVIIGYKPHAEEIKAKLNITADDLTNLFQDIIDDFAYQIVVDFRRKGEGKPLGLIVYLSLLGRYSVVPAIEMDDRLQSDTKKMIDGGYIDEISGRLHEFGLTIKPDSVGPYHDDIVIIIEKL